MSFILLKETFNALNKAYKQLNEILIPTTSSPLNDDQINRIHSIPKEHSDELLTSLIREYNEIVRLLNQYNEKLDQMHHLKKAENAKNLANQKQNDANNLFIFSLRNI